VNGPVFALVRVALDSETDDAEERLMTLKIEQIPGKRRTRIRLSGEFRSEHLDQVKTEIERCGAPVVLDLEELDLIDVEGIRFLNACEASGISALRCSPYIKEWMSRERSRPEARPKAEEGKRGSER
jgi:hypothetical protein